MRASNKQKLDKIFGILLSNILEILLIVGLGILAFATFNINYILGLYIVGVILVIFSLSTIFLTNKNK